MIKADAPLMDPETIRVALELMWAELRAVWKYVDVVDYDHECCDPDECRVCIASNEYESTVITLPNPDGGHMRLLAMHPEDEKLWADLCKAVEDSERCEALEDGIEEALTSPAVCVYDDLRHLLASGKGDSDGA
jgi:hypothetical protein